LRIYTSIKRWRLSIECYRQLLLNVALLNDTRLFLLDFINRNPVASRPSPASLPIVRTRIGGAMKKQQIRTVALTTVLSVGLSMGASAQTDPTLDNILKEGQAMTAAGAASQKRIDKLQEETTDLYQEFKVVNKEIEGLRTYNSQLEKQIANQRQVIDQLTRSIDQVTVIERQVQPLILRMLDSLDQFVELDVPFLL